MNLKLRGKVAMVAAATKGLGYATALELAREGCRVSICARSEDPLARTEAALREASGDRAVAERADVTSQADLERWHQRTVDAFGPVDLLITNTGGPPAGRFLELTEEQWRGGIDATLMNVLRLSRLVIPAMRERRWGRIVHLTSFVAKQPMELLTISSTLRAGLSALTKSMAAELAADNVLVNAVLPGHFMTDRQVHLNELRAREAGVTLEQYEERVRRTLPMQRYGQPEELAAVVAFLCSERASYVTGASLQVDGGLLGGTF